MSIETERLRIARLLPEILAGERALDKKRLAQLDSLLELQADRSRIYIPQQPTEKQQIFLDLNEEREVLFGGACGGGKSSCLLMAALQYAHVPGYAALLLRRTYADLSKPGALMDRAHQWLRGTAAKWNEQKKQWKFPSGASLTFGHLENENDKYNYQGSELQFVGVDELTQLSQSAYTYLFSRLRRLKGSDVPIRMRAASNPGGVGADWVAERFVPEGFTPAMARSQQVFWKEEIDQSGRTIRRAFVPATLDDNPYLDRAEYAESLNELDVVTREQLLRGDWQIRERGNIYPMWDEGFHVITWSEFERLYSCRHIPLHWRVGVGQDWGFTEGHPCITVWVARAAESSPLPGTVFVYRTLSVYGETAREVAKRVNALMQEHHEKERCEMWLMSHEAASERAEYNREHHLPFVAWEAGPNTGIAQVRDYLEIVSRDEPHPFRPHLRGRPFLFCIVDDDQLLHARDDRGLARLRAELRAYRYAEASAGSQMARPCAQFNDACDALRGLARRFFPSAQPRSRDEFLETRLHESITVKGIASAQTASEHAARYWARKMEEKELERLWPRNLNYSAPARMREQKRKGKGHPSGAAPTSLASLGSPRKSGW